MNERIRELAEQAGLSHMPSNWPDMADLYEGADFELAKFAELIVQECVAQIIAKGTDWVDFAPSQTGVRPEYWAMAQQIKEHFGVTE